MEFTFHSGMFLQAKEIPNGPYFCHTPCIKENILLARGRLRVFFGAHNLRALSTSLIFRMGSLIPSMRFGPVHVVHVYKNSNYKSIHVLSHPISSF
jgi:hypothetical protein